MSVVDFTGGARCKDCGDQIEPARIRINPKALRCIECQEDMEFERQRGLEDQLREDLARRKRRPWRTLT